MTDQPITLERLRADIAAMLGEDPSIVGEGDNLMDLGLDSMRAMNLVMQWDEQGVPLDFTDLAEAMTLGGLWAILQERQD